MPEFLAEVVGTMVMIILGGGVVAGVVLKGTKSEGAGWVLITIGWGLGVALGVYAIGQFTGAHLNPAVTLGLASAGEFPWSKVPMYIAAEFTGAIIGACIVFLNYLPHWEKTKDQIAKRDVFCTTPAVRSPFSNLISEMIGTFILLSGILFIGANEFTEGLNPLIIGLLVVAIGMSLGGTTGYAINPARDLGPRIAHAFLPIPGKGGNDWKYSWVPVLGPILGGVYGGVFYNAIFLAKFSVAFWVLSAIIIILFIGAASAELKKGKTVSDKLEEQIN